jgi:hypothetical protein
VYALKERCDYRPAIVKAMGMIVLTVFRIETTMMSRD